MTDLVVPWTPNPGTVAVKTNTSNETIAAGKYGIVTVYCEGDGEFYIDDVKALNGYTQTNITASTMTTGSGQLTSGTGGGTAAYTFTAENCGVTAEFRVPTGTNLKVAGTAGNARYTLALYSEIT